MLHRLGVGIALVGTALVLGMADSTLTRELPRPAGPVVVTVDGAIEHTNAPGRAEFDRAMLEALGLTRLTTWTPWTDGEREFEGVPARRLMEAVGAKTRTVRVVALNDYQSSIPLSDFERYPVLLAMKIDGQSLRVRDKGPIWIVYPWSDHAELDDLATRRKSVWQVETMHVE